MELRHVYGLVKICDVANCDGLSERQWEPYSFSLFSSFHWALFSITGTSWWSLVTDSHGPTTRDRLLKINSDYWSVMRDKVTASSRKGLLCLLCLWCYFSYFCARLTRLAAGEGRWLVNARNGQDDKKKKKNKNNKKYVTLPLPGNNLVHKFGRLFPL